MTRRSLLILLMLLVVSSAATWVRSDDDNAPGNSSDDHWRELEKVRQVAVSASPEQLQKLLGDANDGVAIRAAWEMVRRRLAEDIVADGHNKDGTLLKGADRFLGFIEGRLRVPVPRWWASHLASTRATKCERPMFFSTIDTMEDVWAQIGPRGLSSAFGLVPGVTRITSGDVSLVWDMSLIWGMKSLRVSAKQIPNDPVFEDLTGLIYRDRCLVLGYDRSSFPTLDLALYCVNPRSSDFVWSSKRTLDIRPEGAGGGAQTGSSIHHACLVGRDDVIFVFGMECSLAYIEAFRLSDGRPLMHFNSSY
jgi:hypothetical protein